MKQFQVKNTSSGVTFTVNEGESVLNAALRQGVMLPYSCKNGTCGSCKGMLESGDVHYPFHPPLALSREEIGEGYALLCQAEPTEDLVIRAREIEAVRDITVRKMPARVIEKKPADARCHATENQVTRCTTTAIPGWTVPGNNFGRW